jgi:hypothetical protein
MTTRDELRHDGAALRVRPFGPTPLQRDREQPIPGIGDVVDELTFGAVWSRTGLPVPDRIIATLAALSGVLGASVLGK